MAWPDCSGPAGYRQIRHHSHRGPGRRIPDDLPGDLCRARLVLAIFLFIPFNKFLYISEYVLFSCLSLRAGEIFRKHHILIKKIDKDKNDIVLRVE
jgi:hypothetical protein